MAKNTQNKQNTSIFKKILAIGLAVVLACGLAAGVCSMGFASRNDDGKWFGNFSNLSAWHWGDKIGDISGTDTPNTPDNPDNPDNPDKPSTGDVTTAGGAIISDITSTGGISLLSAVLPREAYAANGISPQAETAFTLNATITPASADDKRVEWTVTDTSGSINASDYITLNANGLTATISCKQAFDRQLTVTVTSLDNPQAKATCTLDYVERVTGLNVNMPKLSSNEATITYTTETSKYTIKSDISVQMSNFQFNENFDTAFVGNDSEYIINYSKVFGTTSNITYSSDSIRFNHIFGSISDSEFLEKVSDNKSSYRDFEGLIGCFYCFEDGTYPSDEDGYVIADFRAVAGQHYLGTVDVTLSSTYGGTTYSSVSKTVEIWVDGASLHIPVTGLSLSNSSIIF